MTAINSNRAIRGPVTAVPVVAGKGVRLVADTENNRWVVEADETVLWSNNRAWVGVDVTSGTNSGTLSETVSNFERIRVYFARNNGTNLVSGNVTEMDTDEITTSGGIFISTVFINTTNDGFFSAQTFLALNGLTFSESLGSQWKQSGNVLDTTKVYLHPYKIVGINRIASN